MLDERRYTEYARVAIALNAIGKDPTAVEGYNLLKNLDNTKEMCIRDRYYPESGKKEYCLSSIICDSAGDLYFLNDSGYLMGLTRTEAWLQDLTIEDNNGCLLYTSILTAIERAEKDTLETIIVENASYIGLSSSEVRNYQNLSDQDAVNTEIAGKTSVSYTHLNKWHGLKDTDIRYRQRYVDLIMNCLLYTSYADTDSSTGFHFISMKDW